MPPPLGFPGIPPLNVEVLSDAMDAMNACLGTPRNPGQGSDLSLHELGSLPPPRAPPPSAVAPPALPTKQAPPDAQVLAEELRKEGVRLVKAGQAAAAELVYTEALKHAPRMHMLYLNRAACYARLGRHADALADARTVVQLAPSVPRGHWQEALALESQGRYEEALQAYERACRAAREADADAATLRVRFCVRTFTPSAPPHHARRLSTTQEYESRRESLRRTTASQADAAARVAKVLADAASGKAARGTRGLFAAGQAKPS